MRIPLPFEKAGAKQSNESLSPMQRFSYLLVKYWNLITFPYSLLRLRTSHFIKNAMLDHPPPPPNTHTHPNPKTHQLPILRPDESQTIYTKISEFIRYYLRPDFQRFYFVWFELIINLCFMRKFSYLKLSSRALK